MEKVGILGSGSVGQHLAQGFKKYGYEVMVGSHHPDKLANFGKEHGVQVGSFKDAAAFGELIVLCVKGIGAEEVVKEVKDNLSGKIVIDTTNAIGEGRPNENGVMKLFTTWDESLMEKLQKLAPEAKFVKAFNSIGAELMVNPDFKEQPSMFFCGNDEAAKKEVSGIITQFGFIPEDMGTATSARALEPLVVLWLLPALNNQGRHHALKWLKK